MRFVMTIGMLALAGVPQLSAQAARPKTQTGTVAGIAPPPPAAAAEGERSRRRPVVTVLPDGRVFADFGHGFEQVVRGCGGAVSPSVSAPLVAAPANGNAQPRAAQPAVVQPPAAPTQPLPYTPPVPAQQTASQQAAQSQTATAATQSCWSTDARGQVFVVHP